MTLAQATEEQQSQSQKAMQDLEASLNKASENIGLKVQLWKDANGGYGMYFMDLQGKAIPEDELKEKLKTFKTDVLLKMKGTEFVLAVGTLKENGLTDKEISQIKNADGEIRLVEQKARAFIEKSEFKIKEEGSAGEGAGAGEGEMRSRAHLVDNKTWDSWWREARKVQFELDHIKAGSEDKVLGTSRVGLTEDTAEVGTTGKKGGQGKVTHKFKIKMDTGMQQKFHSGTTEAIMEMQEKNKYSLKKENDGSITWMHKGDMYTVIDKDGNLDQKGYNNFEWANRDAQKEIYAKIKSKFTEDEWKQFESAARKKYEEDFGRGKRPSMQGLVIGLSVALAAKKMEKKAEGTEEKKKKEEKGEAKTSPQTMTAENLIKGAAANNKKLIQEDKQKIGAAERDGTLTLNMIESSLETHTKRVKLFDQTINSFKKGDNKRTSWESIKKESEEHIKWLEEQKRKMQASA